MDGLNLGGPNEDLEQPKTVDAVSEAPEIPTVEGVEPPKGVEAYGEDKGPETTLGDSGTAEKLQNEVAQECPTDKVGRFAPAHADEQDTPTGVCSFSHLVYELIAPTLGSIHKDISSEEVILTDHPIILPTESIAHVATVECPAEEPTHSVDQDGKPAGHPKPVPNETAVQDAVDGAPRTREAIVDPVSEVTPTGT
jgi:hypothetical protein